MATISHLRINTAIQSGNSILLNTTAAIIVITALLLSTNSLAQSKNQPLLLALSKSDHTLAIVNPATLKVLARVPVGPDPHEVIASADGKTAYVTNTGGGRSYEINVIDLVAQKAMPNIDTRPLIGPHGIYFEGGKVWFSAEGAKAVGRYDPATGKLDWSMGTGQDRTHMVYVTSDEKKIYTTNVSSGSVSILSDTLLPAGQFSGGQPRHEWTQTVVKVSRGTEGIDVSPDGKQLWTAASEDGTIAVIDLASKKLVFTIDGKVLGANRLKFTPDGKYVLVSTLRSGDLTIIDVATRKEIKKINMGTGAAGILAEGNGSRAFVACTADNYVAIIDLTKLEMTGRIDVGGGPDGLAWAIQH